MPLVTLPARTSRQGMIRLASIGRRSEVQPAEVVEQPEAGRAALLEMELGRDYIAPRDRRCERYAVIRIGDDQRRIGRNRIIRIDEIEVRAIRYSCENRMGLRLAHAIPSDLRHLEPATID